MSKLWKWRKVSLGDLAKTLDHLTRDDLYDGDYYDDSYRVKNTVVSVTRSWWSYVIVYYQEIIR